MREKTDRELLEIIQWHEKSFLKEECDELSSYVAAERELDRREIWERLPLD